MTDYEYNGWSNWETWNANLWLTNDQGTYGTCLEAIGNETNRYEAGQCLREAVEMWADEGIRLIGDELTMWRIVWAEIADGFIEDRDYDEEDDDE